MAYTQSEITANVADDYTRRFYMLWLTYSPNAKDPNNVTSMLARINQDRKDAGLVLLDKNTI